jgi:glycosyltransferase involved in cell wall biosynthesis
LLRPQYNIETIVAAFKSAATTLSGWTLDILTGGSDVSRFLDDANDLPAENRIVPWPRIDRRELQRRFLEAAIFCSVPDSDGTSVALLEGMASGTFPIVSDLASNRDWVTDGENGLVVPARDVKGLADALERAARDDGLRRRACQVNRALVARRATWEHAVETVLAEYARIVRS